MRSMVEAGIPERCASGEAPPPAYGWSPSPRGREELAASLPPPGKAGNDGERDAAADQHLP